MKFNRYESAYFSLSRSGEIRTPRKRVPITQSLSKSITSAGCHDVRFHMFPGYEEFFRSFDKSLIRGDKRLRITRVFPPIANIPATAGAMSGSRIGNKLSDFFSDPVFARWANLVFNYMASEKYWDERVYHRFVAMNEFLNSGGSLTYGEFVEENDKPIEELFMNGTSKNYDHTYGLAYACIENSVLCFRNFGKHEAIANLFDSLTRDECLSIVEKGVLLFDGIKRAANVAPYFRRYTNHAFFKDFPGVIDPFRRESEEISVEKIRDIFLTSLIKSIDTFTTGKALYFEMIQDFSKYTKPLMNMKYFDEKVVLAKEVASIASEATPVEILSIMFALNHPRETFADTTPERAVVLLSDGIKNAENKVDFMTFISQVIFDHNGPLPSEKEWKDYIASENADYSLGPIITMGLISDAADKPSHRFIGDIRRFRDRYSKWAD